MTSLHDARFGLHAVPALQNEFATENAVDIVLGGNTIVTNADAILHQVEARDEFTAANILAKRSTMLIDILVDKDDVIGLDDDLTNAQAVVLGDTWAIDHIVSITANQQRLQLTRFKPRNKTRSGYYRNT